jgi:hypothetical protein
MDVEKENYNAGVSPMTTLLEGSSKWDPNGGTIRTYLRSKGGVAGMVTFALGHES